MILVDTSVWIDFLRGRSSPERHVLHRLIEEEEDLSIAGIILAEVLQGIRAERDFQRIRQYLLEFPIYQPRGIETYLKAAGMYRGCRKKGKTVRKTIDCVIASICLENDLVLLHKDHDFGFLEACVGLKCYKI